MGLLAETCLGIGSWLMQRVMRGINGLFVDFSVDVIADLDRQARAVGVMPVPKLHRKFLAVPDYFLIIRKAHLESVVNRANRVFDVEIERPLHSGTLWATCAVVCPL
jgi:hypothetical protein